jgi:hypothetical protein
VSPNIKSILLFTVLAVLISPQVFAFTTVQNETNIENSLLAESLWFVKPVLKKMYIYDSAEIDLLGNRSIIVGPITLQAGTEAQNELISVEYRFKDLDGSSLGPDVEIDWSVEYPNYDFYYAKKHFPIPFGSFLPSKFVIEIIAKFIGIPYAYQNITVFKLL